MSQVPTRKGVRCPQNGFLFPTVDGSEIPSPTTWDFLKTLANNGINYQPQLVISGFLKHQLYHWLVPVSAHTIHAWYIYLHICHKIQPNEGKFRGFLSNPTLIFFHFSSVKRSSSFQPRGFLHNAEKDAAVGIHQENLVVGPKQLGVGHGKR